MFLDVKYLGSMRFSEKGWDAAVTRYESQVPFPFGDTAMCSLKKDAVLEVTHTRFIWYPDSIELTSQVVFYKA